MEKEGHLPFLDIDIYRKTDGALGQSLSEAHPHPSIIHPYLHWDSHHHPANNQFWLL
jgi:hypothetical protein